MNVGLKVHVPPHPQSDIPRSVGESLMKKSKTCLHHWAFAGVPDQVRGKKRKREKMRKRE